MNLNTVHSFIILILNIVYTAGVESVAKRLIYRVEEVNLTQLSQRELQQIFEKLCNSDFQTLRQFCRYLTNNIKYKY